MFIVLCVSMGGASINQVNLIDFDPAYGNQSNSSFRELRSTGLQSDTGRTIDVCSRKKERTRRIAEEVFSEGNKDLADEFMAPDFVEHEELPPGIPPGREASKQLMAMIHTAFPDFKANIDDMIAKDDKVVIRMTWTGTHEGEFMGVPPTGRIVSVGVLDIIPLRRWKGCRALGPDGQHEPDAAAWRHPGTGMAPRDQTGSKLLSEPS